MPGELIGRNGFKLLGHHELQVPRDNLMNLFSVTCMHMFASTFISPVEREFVVDNIMW